MNILLLNHYAGSPEFGMEFRPYYMAREWVHQGHTVTIISGDYSHLRQKNPTITDDFQEDSIDGITYTWIRTGTYEGNGAARAFSMFRFVSKLWMNTRLIVTRYRPDIVIASSTYPLETYAAQRIARESGAKYVHEVHDMWPATLYEVGGMSRNHPFVQLMQVAEDSAYRHCYKCVSLAPYAKNYMIEHGLDPSKFVHISNGIVLEEWENPQPLPEEHLSTLSNLSGKFVVGYFGGHALSNALDVLLDAAKLVTDEDVQFVLVGDGVEKKRLITRVETEQISNVLFLPSVPKPAVPSLVAYFSCSYMGGLDSPLYRFGLCLNKMFDSMAAGVPIICAFNAPPTPITDFNCGLQVSPNPKEIADAITMLKKLSAQALSEMGERGRTAATSEFSYTTLATKFIHSLVE